jgi:serine/threonine protein kinase
VATEGCIFTVMELLHGQPLRALLARSTLVRADRALDLLRQVADALDYAHDAGVVQRDIQLDWGCWAAIVSKRDLQQF